MTAFFIRLAEEATDQVKLGELKFGLFLTGEVLFSCAILHHINSFDYGVFDYQLELLQKHKLVPCESQKES